MQVRRIEALQGLRAIAFFAVFLSHTGLGLDALGNWGVSVFFCLSGFLMLINYHDRMLFDSNNFNFAWKKIKKLYPLHVSMMIPAAVYAFISGVSIRKIAIELMLHAALVQIWIPIPEFYRTLNNVTWYLSASVFLYFMFPWILKVMKQASKRMSQLAIIGLIALQLFIALIAKQYGNEDTNATLSMYWITYFCPISRLVDFVLGCCLGKLFLLRSQKTKCKRYTVYVEMLIIAAMCLVVIAYDQKSIWFGREYIKYTLLFMPVTMMLIWKTATGGVISHLLESSALVKIGDMSPYTYLIHYVAIEYCSALANQITTSYSKVLVAAVSLAVTFVASRIWIELFGLLVNARHNCS